MAEQPQYSPYSQSSQYQQYSHESQPYSPPAQYPQFSQEAQPYNQASRIEQAQPYEQTAQYQQFSEDPQPYRGYRDEAPPMASTNHGSRSGGSIAKDTAELFKKTWPRAFFMAAAVQALVCIIFEAYTFARFQSNVNETGQSDSTVQSQLRTIPTFLSLFIFGFIYELVLVWDALRQKNTIQVIGLCIANLILLVYTAIQIDQIGQAITILQNAGALNDPDIWSKVRPLLVAIPVILAVITMVLGFIAWKLYQEFAWDILKQIGADYRMKQRFLHYQIYIALLKFDFFFFIGFTVQFLVVVTGKSDTEQDLTIAAVPITIIILICAGWFVRREWKIGMVCIIVLYLGGLAYFIFKLSRIYDPAHEAFYIAVRKSLTAFAVITILLIILTIVNAMVCMFNFGTGLKHHLNAAPQVVDKDQTSYSLNDVKPQLPSRMTID